MGKRSPVILMPKDDYEIIAANVNKETKKIIRGAKKDARKIGVRAGILYALFKL